VYAHPLVDVTDRNTKNDIVSNFSPIYTVKKFDFSKSDSCLSMTNASNIDCYTPPPTAPFGSGTSAGLHLVYSFVFRFDFHITIRTARRCESVFLLEVLRCRFRVDGPLVPTSRTVNSIFDMHVPTPDGRADRERDHDHGDRDRPGRRTP